MAIASLIYRAHEARTGKCAGILIAIHSEGADLNQLASLCTNLDLPLKVLCPQAPRAVNPRSQGSGDDGNYAWFFMDKMGEPEPATFGDCLWELEQFTFDALEQHGAAMPIFVIGYGQGALLALTLAGMVPEYVKGVVATDGYLPKTRDWSVLSADMLGMPILLLCDRLGPPELRNRIDRSAHELSGKNASVSIEEISELQRDISAASCVLKNWFIARLPS
jgi:predicted esterase